MKKGGARPSGRTSEAAPRGFAGKPAGHTAARGKGEGEHYTPVKAGRPPARPADRPEQDFRPRGAAGAKAGPKPPGRRPEPRADRPVSRAGRDSRETPEKRVARPERDFRTRDKGPRAEEAIPARAPEHAEADERVAGINPVLELLRSGGRPLDALYIDREKGGPQFQQMVTLARRAGVQVKVVPKAALDGMSGGARHQGAVAAVSPKAYDDPYAMAEKALAKDKKPILVVLDGVEDPQNLGAIIRTAEGAGADGVVIPEHRAAHLSAAVARASAGALEHVPVAKVSNIAGYLDFLKGKGFWIVGLAGEAGKDYSLFGMDVPLAVVLGGEGSGIRPIVRNACDALVSIPMLGKVSSLNVSVSAGIILYEAVRQRKKSG